MAADFERGNGSPLDFGGQQVPEQLGTIVKWGAVIAALIAVLGLCALARAA